jgi:hypothetical protein
VCHEEEIEEVPLEEIEEKPRKYGLGSVKKD